MPDSPNPEFSGETQSTEVINLCWMLSCGALNVEEYEVKKCQGSAVFLVGNAKLDRQL